MIGMRSGAPDTSSDLHIRALGGNPPDTRYTTSAPFFVGAPHGPFNLDARRLPADQPPHLQHQSVESRKPNWCER